MKKVIAIVGPTAVGKSALGLKLAQEFQSEIISGDSMQIYRHLDIGTAKDSPAELRVVPHHLVNICDPDQRYTVKNFQERAKKIITDLNEQGKIPFVVGGTGFYLSSLINNLNLGGNSAGNDEVRQELLEIEKNDGVDRLQAILKSEDPIAYQKIDIENSRRLIRAIEVIRTTGKSITDQNNGNKWANFYLIGLTDDRPKLYERINRRVDKMVEMGLLDEAEYVFKHRETFVQAKNAIGYKELFPYFEQKASLESCLDEIKKNSRHFAKRQFTYFRNQMDVDWYNIGDDNNYQKTIEKNIIKFVGGHND
ncbi:tRNA (adenosine(37)-N6)-dimethylallyltransferase MiaA [Companilactobacillus kimchii]|uniref:tRNA dimethylallyltransferase n=2 Tax=Companilactobacillus kimchii TaxID=2801452 RepID=A0ABR5NQG2_9LACO|nr:tRNA (adenosine(37)-N6)-dimethylallyltransferase MiaA [Companilactobacillus kimchii]KAE9562862.1 tRNA dimethylallyltransferase [Companilactobacillus kimchii]KRK49895.1 tRNA isopentenyltransferase (tRNA delta(2)-isopentenylpyrophosphate transferase) (IPP transferase) [Companilactobacillus kimchii DSM 13961 = JCM 10707]OWF33136.1 tRNA dimethylallyltransferase [Companilactobacillus kimchii]GEO46779.1 tRNA dimethylallyltransferase [Companilactobacillus paralimentarius]